MVHLLLIEDNAGDALLLQEMLVDNESIATEITHRQKLQDSLASLVENTYDLILLDLTLPDRLGWEALEKVRELDFDTTIIILTCNEDRDL